MPRDMVPAPTPPSAPPPRKRMGKAAATPTLTDGQVWLLRYTYITDPNATLPYLATLYAISAYRVAQYLSGPAYELVKAEVQRDSVAKAKDMLLSLTEEATSAWRTAMPVAAKKGDHRPARDLLMANRVVERHDTTPAVSIVIGVQAGSVAVTLPPAPSTSPLPPLAPAPPASLALPPGPPATE